MVSGIIQAPKGVKLGATYDEVLDRAYEHQEGNNCVYD